MNDTNNRQIIQHEETTSNSVNVAGVGTSNATITGSTYQATADEEEQVVTSTSNESSGNTPHHPPSDFPDPALHSFTTSPARITSSTGNDYSSSPTQQAQSREEAGSLLLSSEDDSSEQVQATTTLAKGIQPHKRSLSQQEQSAIFNVAMPTTSAAAAATSASHIASGRLQDKSEHNSSSDKKNCSLDRCRQDTPGEEKSGSMVARDSGNNLAGTGSNSEPSDNQLEKIILKLPKPTQPTNKNESQHSQYHTRQHQQRRDEEHLIDNDPSMSNSCSNSSTNSSTTAEADTRKVEPLKINLHHGTHHYQHHSPSSSSSATDAPHVIPKITIKPLFKKSSDGATNTFENTNSDSILNDSVCKQAEAAPNNVPIPIPKLTIKAGLPTGSSCTMSVGENTNSEPHIVPKLTIRAAHEEGGCTHTSVVPKLTIKISDTQSPHAMHNSLHSPSAAKVLSGGSAESGQQPPLPKLTIKTKLDGASGSSIMSSSISPASSSSNSSSSATSSPHSVVPSSMGSASSSVIGATSVPKLTIKTVTKNVEEPTPIVPKFTIKTSASGSCVTTTEPGVVENSVDADVPGGSNSINKIPKMTIKTGQEHAVIITQHKSDQTIPKLTIKTKSIDLEDSLGDSSKDIPPAEKIPKITIKNPSVESVAAIPRRATSSPHSPKTHCSPLVVRQVAVSPTTTRKTQSPDRVPKLMISRQDVSNNHSTESPSEKTVPKLTIKTSLGICDQDEEVKDKSMKYPKLTIKTLPPPPNETQQSSEDSEDGMSVDSGQSPLESEAHPHTNKVVPKLTITNLGSPKLKLKTILGDKSSADKHSNETSSLGGQKKAQNSHTQPHSEGQNSTKNERAPTNVVANGGESSSSQEFCGFTENTLDSPAIVNQVATDVINRTGSHEDSPEVRRGSDDMDIDEGLQSHDPKIFKNLTHFGAIRNGETYGIHLDNNLDALPIMSTSNNSPSSIKFSREVVDMVDLTSSPSPGSSPAHFNYTDADPKMPEYFNASQQSNALLIECLQRGTSVIQSTPRIPIQDVRQQPGTPKEPSNSLLLNQLTAPLRHPLPPPLHPRPPHHFNSVSNILNYPQFADHHMPNGSHSISQHQAIQQSMRPSYSAAPSSMNLSQPLLASVKQPATVIDSIEILDTPEGSPRSSQDDSQSGSGYPNHLQDINKGIYMGQEMGNEIGTGLLRHNNNIINHIPESLDLNHSHLLKRSAKDIAGFNNDCLRGSPNKMRRTGNLTPTMATLTIFTNDNVTNASTIITTSPTIIGGTVEGNGDETSKSQITPKSMEAKGASNTHQTPHRSRKQKHDNILDVPIDELDQVDIGTKSLLKQLANSSHPPVMASAVSTPETVTPAPKKRGRPKRIRPEEQPLQLSADPKLAPNTPSTPNISNCSTAERRVQLLRKRLAIDMVSAEHPGGNVVGITENAETASPLEEGNSRRERMVRTTRRCGTPNSISAEKQSASATKQRKQRISNSNMMPNCETVAASVASLNHFGGSNSSLSSACSSNSSYATNVTTTATAHTGFSGSSNLVSAGPNNCRFSMNSQIDLTMSSPSSTCSGNTTTTLTTLEGNGRPIMLPPTKALSSTDPLPDVVFQSKDFSAIMLTQQFNSVHSSPSSRKSSRANSQEGDDMGSYTGSGSGDDSTLLTSPLRTPGRGRGRGRGRGSRGGPRAHRLGRGASAVAKAIAMNRPRCVGGLKHTPDPERMKGLFTPSPQVFEEDTRMSADMNQTLQNSEPQMPIRQPDFLANEEESQSSIISNSSASILDPNTIAAVQNGASVKRYKKKKMEVCAADETEYTVSSIAEYDWPPPKGCCPSKNRDTFMIQEQVANYLGIKSFKRKYPDLPRRQIDMEERNWLQEKGLVSEKMCDLGITAVWASDILDIMYADFFEKYEEYKDYVRQKHLREIEAKQKSLGLNISGRGLQARDRAMLSASKWNAYFNKTRKDERPHCLDLQNLMVNVPLPSSVPATTVMNRSIAEEIAKAASIENIDEPPTLLKSLSFPSPEVSSYYPVAVVPSQYASAYRSYSSSQLRAFPLNTVIDGPLRKELALTTAEDTDSNSETHAANESSEKRSKKRHSRRVRSERSFKQNCDKKDENRPTSRQSEKLKLLVEESASEVDSATESCTESFDSSSSSSSCSEATSCTSDSEGESENESPAVCTVCQRTQNRNPKDLPELFISCYTCRRKVHPSCIEMPHRMTLRVRNYNWQCADCKCCIKCKRKQEPNKMLYCEQCDRGFHIYCLGVKSVPDGRWSCERCSVCMRCGATKPEGLPQQQQQLCSPNGEKVKPVKHKKVKWINEYRIDHITKLREHCSMLCVPCGRSRTSIKRVQISTGNSSHNAQGNSSRNSSLSPGFCSTTQQQQQHSPQSKPQVSLGVSTTKTNVSNTTGVITSTTNTFSATVLTSNAVNSTNTMAPETSTTSASASKSPSPPPVVA